MGWFRRQYIECFLTYASLQRLKYLPFQTSKIVKMISDDPDALNSLPTPTWWEERTISHRLTSDSHTMLPWTHIK